MNFPFFETFILSLFDVLQYYVITNKLNSGRLKFESWHIVVLLSGTMCAAMSSNLVEGIYAYFLNTFIVIALNWFLYRRTGLQLMYLHILGITIALMVQLALLIPIYIVMGKIEYTPNLGYAAQVTALAIVYLIAKYLPIHVLFRFIETKNNIFRVVSLNVFVLLTFCVIYWYVRFEGVVENLISISVIVVVVLLINLIFLRDGLKNHVLEEQNRAYKLYLPIVSELMDEIRIKQHDFDNHIAALKIVLENRREAEVAIERVEDYIHEIDSSFRHVDLLKIQNRIIAGFLYSKKKQSIEESISMDICVDNCSLQTELKDYELLEILSILIDNAFETGIQDNHVKVHFYKEKSKSVIEISNKHPYIQTGQLNDFFTKGFSSKSTEKRGLGLYKLKQLVLKCQGELEVLNVDYGENYVVFKISLP